MERLRASRELPVEEEWSVESFSLATHTLKTRRLRKKSGLSKPSFDLGTYGLWAHHAHHCATSKGGTSACPTPFGAGIADAP